MKGANPKDSEILKLDKAQLSIEVTQKFCWSISKSFTIYLAYMILENMAEILLQDLSMSDSSCDSQSVVPGPVTEASPGTC